MEESFLITNGPVRSFYNELIENLNSCSQFKISVAFITYGGLQVLLETLKALETRNIQGEILTTTYKEMTSPQVLERLSKFKNIHLKIYVPPTQNDGFHAKGYLFHKTSLESEKWTLIIGSHKKSTNKSTFLNYLIYGRESFISKNHRFVNAFHPVCIKILFIAEHRPNDFCHFSGSSHN